MHRNFAAPRFVNHQPPACDQESSVDSLKFTDQPRQVVEAISQNCSAQNIFLQFIVRLDAIVTALIVNYFIHIVLSRLTSNYTDLDITPFWGVIQVPQRRR
jgi:hypothetical protein